MASLEVLSKSYGLKKASVSKLRKQVEKKLHEAVSQKRRSSSGLIALEKKKEDLTRAKDHVNQVLNHLHSQKASIERLKIAAEERLVQEQDAKDQAKQQSDYGAETEKANAIQNLKYIDTKIAELHLELKERESFLTRLEKEVESALKQKVKVEGELKKQHLFKPGLVEKLKAGTKNENTLRPRYESLLKSEAAAGKSLAAVHKKLAEAAAQKRKRMAAIAARKRRTRRQSRKTAKRSARRKVAKRPARKASRSRTRKASKRNKSRRR